MTKFTQSKWPLRGVLSALLLSPFLAWAATPGNDATATRAEGAFLLGLDLADYTEDMKIVAVALQGNKFTIDAPSCQVTESKFFLALASHFW